LSSFRISQIVVIESLESHEVRTGEILYDFLQLKVKNHDLTLPIQYVTCENKFEFLSLLKHYAAHAKTSGNVPLVHVECHGDERMGLEFSNGSQLTWSELSDSLTELNRATRFNLLAVFSACYGAHFLGRIQSISPSPCWAMVAPSHEVNPADILRAFRVFYSVLLGKRDVTQAVNEIRKLPLIKGKWLDIIAETWFELVTINYVKVHCTKRVVRQRAKKMYRQLLSEGSRVSIGKLKRILRSRNRSSLLTDHFNAFFMIDSSPENLTRFESVQRRMQSTLSSLRSQGRYMV
jgi:hypothetical protein